MQSTIRKAINNNSLRFLHNHTKQINNGAKHIVQALEKNDFELAFGYSGGAILPVLDALTFSRIKFIMNRDEQCAGHAATGYVKSSNKMGLVISTSGPGVTNLVTPFYDALTDGIPILGLTGQVPTNAIGTDAFQECPAVDITKSVTKWSYQVKKGDDLSEVIKQAVDIMMCDRRGPVHIDLPKDIMMNLYNNVDNKNIYFHNLNLKRSTKKSISEKDLNSLVTLIESAKKPIIIAGQGCNFASKELNKFIKKTNIPVTTTLHAMGVYDERKSKSLHMLGMHGSVYANYSVQESDLILALGCRLDDRITGNINGHAPKAHQAYQKNKGGLIHIDNSLNQIYKVKKISNPDISICSDVKTILNELNTFTFNNDISEWLNQIKKWKKDYPFFYIPSKFGKPKTQEVIKKIYNYVESNKLNNNLIITTGVGNHQMMSAQFYRWTRPNSIITSGSSGTMGVGLPFAIGSQFANPDKTVLALDGDGSFNMTLNDLGTIAENNLPIKIVIFNDKRQQMVHVWQKLFFEKRFIATDNYNPNFADLAESYGITGLKCQNSDDVSTTIELMMEHKKAILVEFDIEPDTCLPLVAPGKNLDEMITDYSKVLPMEGLAPS